MIFPSIRISELKNDSLQKRQRFDESVTAVKDKIRSYANPLTLIKKHPSILVGALASGMGGFKLISGLFGHIRKPKKGENTSDQGWLRKIALFGGRLILGAVLPQLSVAIESVLLKAFKKPS